jgi:alpha-L-rhamnosidase
MGWTGDLQAFARTATYNSEDTQAFLRQWMVAIRDAQGVNGGIGDTVPIISLTGDRGTSYPQSPTWEGAVCQVPWQLYQQYGDTRIIKENFATVKKWLESVHSGELHADYPALTSRTSGNADHISMDSNTQAHMVGQSMYLYYINISSKMADVIGETEYAETLKARYAQAKDSFNRLYVDPNTGYTLNATPGANVVTGRTLQDSQASYATPLALDLFSETMTIQSGPNAGMTYKEFAAKRLAELIEDPALSNDGNGPGIASGMFSGGASSNKPYTITTGFNGTPNILPALTKSGDIETAYKLFSNDQFASWLYPVTLGAKTMWELWNSYERALGQGGQSSMNSQNHYALGASQAWMYEYQLGITSNGAKGYKDFVLQPVPGGDFTSLKGSFESNYGTIASSWTASDGKLTSYQCVVPANTTATLYLPVSSVGSFKDINGVSYVGAEEHNGIPTAKFSLSSGGYKFTVAGNNVSVALGSGFAQPAAPEQPITPPAQPGPADQVKSPDQGATLAPVSIAESIAVASKIADQAWTGKQVKPAVSISVSGKLLVADTDYQVSYGANKFIGKGSVTVTGKGAYTGAKTLTFKIIPKKNSIKKVTVGKKSAKVSFKKVSSAQKVTGYQVQYRQKGTSTWKTKTVSAKKSNVTIKGLKKGKRYQFRVRAYKTVAKVRYDAPWSATKTGKKIK